MKEKTGVALIGDVVGSRTHADRAGMQRALVAVLDEVNKTVPADQPLAPTIGAEFQAVYADAGTAIIATLRLRLSLPAGLDCSFGLGAGTYADVARSHYGVMQDGPAWWSARDAIVIAKQRESRKNKTLRTWYVVADGPAERGGKDLTQTAAVVNALLLCRDQIVGGMNVRQCRLLRGLLDGHTQAALAAAEGISPSAVSQSLLSSGAFAVIAAHDQLAGVTR